MLIVELPAAERVPIQTPFHKDNLLLLHNNSYRHKDNRNTYTMSLKIAIEVSNCFPLTLSCARNCKYEVVKSLFEQLILRLSLHVIKRN